MKAFLDTLTIMLLAAGTVAAQVLPDRPGSVVLPEKVEIKDKVKENDEEGSRIVLPVFVPYQISALEDEPVHLMQTGAFLSPAWGGLEMTFRPGLEPVYGSLFFSTLFSPGDRMPNIRHIYTTGLTVGYETLLYTTGEQHFWKPTNVVRAGAEGVQFYTRFGPGIGIAGVGRMNGTTDFHPTLHTTAIMGMLAPFGFSGGLYIEIGGRTAWYPTLHKIGLIGGPQLTIGFQLSQGRQMQVPPVSF